MPFVVDAVYAMAHALANMHREKCPGHRKVCLKMFPIAGPDLLYYIRNVSFTGKWNFCRNIVSTMLFMYMKINCV